MNHFFVTLSVSLLLLGSFGCGKSKSIATDSVTGVVTIDGAPVSGAVINFTPKQGSKGNPAYANTKEDGTYVLQTLLGAADAGTTPGDYIVTISKTVNEPSGRKEPDPDNPGTMVDIMKPKEELPLLYKNPDRTPFSATVVSGQKNVFDFPLKSKP